MRVVGTGRSQVDDRAKIEIDAERAQAFSLLRPVVLGAPALVTRPDEAGQRRHGFEQG